MLEERALERSAERLAVNLRTETQLLVKKRRELPSHVKESRKVVVPDEENKKRGCMATPKTEIEPEISP